MNVMVVLNKSKDHATLINVLGVSEVKISLFLSQFVNSVSKQLNSVQLFT